jgi:hypothetical protein
VGFEVLPVIPERFKDMAELFDQPGGSIARSCFCMYFRHTGKPQYGHSNRAEMKRLVDAGTIPGLIGYEDGVPVGWVSLGKREEYPKLQRSPVAKPVDEKEVWSIVCFFVSSSVRDGGISEQMLRGAIDYARSQGASLLEGYPLDKPERGHDDFAFYGSKSIFDRAGFKEVARRRTHRPVVRKSVRRKRSS